jgi:hypothetical protein
MLPGTKLTIQCSITVHLRIYGYMPRLSVRLNAENRFENKAFYQKTLSRRTAPDFFCFAKILSKPFGPL